MSNLSHLVRLGKTELKVSPICYGTWQLSPRFWGAQDETTMFEAMHRAFEAGVNFYDTAGAYGEGHAEEVLGRGIADLPREQVVVATKVYWHFHADGRRYPDLSKEYVLEYCDDALRRMKLDYVDLLQCHSWDPLTPLDEVVEALERLTKWGKIRAYGTSNWNVDQLRYGQSAGNFSSDQPPYSLVNRGIEKDCLPYCQSADIGTLVYSSLHLGLLSGKYKGNETFTDVRKNNPDFQGERFKTLCERIAKVGEMARDRGMSTVQYVLAATLMHPGITCAIVGVKTPDQIVEAAGAMGKSLSREEWHAVRNLLQG
jgi:aryl-alcohol dehydrogenase-like predicted oxidoreductase